MLSTAAFLQDLANLVTNTFFYNFVVSLKGLAEAAGNLNGLLGLIK
ncbi:hypothetical protein [Corynebacterium spheniscorum]|uniref:Uncharacterized protein n=1 Tax=Corynebacterium spheniscorum TaxID=185761 RepID=A0A1I2T2J8_9CORY|nr:hypothetical protein [Corynebacterium spheniscorum]SFG59030.1 hypothetical protein SAMN05660282_01313 [Corynebacterium spheniscorum]